MTKKLTAYQKLKEENLKLKQDIYKLVMLENSNKLDELMDCLGTKIKWDLRFKLEEKIWSGSPAIIELKLPTESQNSNDAN
jgi:hypothetical protein